MISSAANPASQLGPSQRPDQAKRLEELQDEAARVRVELSAGRMTPEQAAEQLTNLIQRNRSILSRLLHRY